MSIRRNDVKKIFLIALSLILSPAFAIDWQDISKNNTKLFLDKDSIIEYNNYYFYNILTTKNNGEEIVITMQFQKTHPFGARVKYYTLTEYNKLDGDYDNLTKNITSRLEPVSFESRAYTSYRKVKEIKSEKNKLQIVF